MKTFAPKGNIFGPILPQFILEMPLSLGAKVMYALLCFAFGLGELLEEEQWVNAAFFLLLCAVMLLFDRCLTPMTILYEKKLRPRLGRR